MLVKNLFVVAFALLVSAASFSPVAWAGAVGGPKARVERVEAHDVDVYAAAFEHCRWAKVSVQGDGDTDLDLYVYDADGVLIACDEGSTDTCSVTWRAGETCEYTIRVVNRGCVDNCYWIATN